MEEGLIVETPEYDAYRQMAADELLCETLPAAHVLRFYNWGAPGVTFGYSQRIKAVKAEVEAQKPGLKDIVRRPTGGGIVFHDADMTFSFIFRQPGASFGPAKTYDRLHRAITGVYARAGVGFELLSALTPDYRTNDPAMDCFAKPVNLDILYNGKKVLGGALRKFGDHVLYQASFQAPDARSGAGFHRNAVLKALGEEFGLAWRTAGFGPAEKEKVKALVLSKYGTKEWNERI